MGALNIILGIAAAAACVFAARRKPGSLVAADWMERHERALVIGLMIVGGLLRLIAIGYAPAGLNQDEASMGYDAWALLHYGIDRSGYHNPVYMVAWGSGQNALYGYLAMPFIALLGPTPLALRLPSAILGTASLFVFYLLLRRQKRGAFALAGLAFFAVCPWHVMLSRWALESNILPAFLLLGLYFCLRAQERPGFFLLSAAVFGLSLYAYAPAYIVVPILLLLCTIILLYTRRLKFRYAIIGAGIFGLIALPLLLFVLVNKGIIGEIITPLFSIPKLTVYRGSEVGLSMLGKNAVQLLRLLFLQSDGLLSNGIEGFGIYYLFSVPFLLAGLIVGIREVACAAKRYTVSAKKKAGRKRNNKITENGNGGGGALRCPILTLFVLVWFAAALLMSVLLYTNINRANALWIPVIYFTLRGLWFAAERMGKAAVGLAAVYCCAAIAFCGVYATSYQKSIGPQFHQSLNEAIDCATDLTQGYIYVDASINMPYIYVLLNERIPPQDFLQTVQWKNPNAAFRWPLSFGRWKFTKPDSAARVVIIDTKNVQAYQKAGYTVHPFANYAVAERLK